MLTRLWNRLIGRHSWDAREDSTIQHLRWHRATALQDTRQLRRQRTGNFSADFYRGISSRRTQDETT